MKHSTHIIVLILSLLSLPASAQRARLYTSESGLPNTQINSIRQDSRGFIWISTENGLSRFDGINFSNFSYDKSRSDALASNLVLEIFEDSRGVFWTATSTGLQIFDPDYNTFSRFDLGDETVPGSTQHVSSIAEIGNELWVACSQHGIYVIDLDTHQLKSERRAELGSLIPSLFVYKLFRDSAGRIWMASETGGLSVLDGRNNKKLSILWSSSGSGLPEDISVTSFAEDERTGKILIGSNNRGLFIFDSTSGTISGAGGETSRCRVTALLAHRTDRRPGGLTFLVGTEDQGLKVYDPATGILREPGEANIPYNTSSWKIHSLLEDNQGNIWAGAFDTGVLVIPESMYGFEYISASPDPYSAEAGSCVSSILSDNRDGSLWIGTDGSGIIHTGTDGSRNFINSSNSGLNNNSVLALVQDKRGTIWVGTYIDGLYSMNSQRDIRHHDISGQGGTVRIGSLAYDPVRDLLYIGTYGSGLAVVSLPLCKVEKTFTDDDCKWVSSLYIGKSGEVWIGTYNGPLSYDPSDGKLTRHEAIQARVYSFCESRKGDITWVGTGEGLFRYEHDNDRASLYSEQNGLSSNVVTAVLESDDGNIWASTSNGLSRLNPETGMFTKYYSYDGLQGNEFRYGSAFKDDTGVLYFGGTTGLTRFYPEGVDSKPHPMPSVFLTSLSVMNEPVEFDAERENGNILDKHITEATSITLPYSGNTFNLGFSVLEYTNPRKISYAYRLDKFDSEWHYTNSLNHSATYTRLPRGRYNFTVKAFLEGNENDFSSTGISIRILPPWYLTPGAFIFYILALSGLLLLLLSMAKRRRVHLQDLKESEIKDLKLNMFTNISHEIRTPLTLVMSPLKKMREAESDPHQKDLYNLMYRNCLRINRLVNQLMDMRKIDNGQMQLHFLETDIVYFIKDIMQSFENLALSRRIDFTINSFDEQVNIWIDQGNFDKVIFNLLSNAFKHTPDEGHIGISISGPLDNGGKLSSGIASCIRIDISNSGSHIEEKNLEKVFERFFQTDVLDAKVGSGVGLSLTKQLVELHHGLIGASNGNGGVVFTVLMPMGNAHLSEAEMSRTSHHKDLYTKNIEDLNSTTEDISFTPTDSSAKAVKSKKNLVIVDDDAEIRAYLRSELKDTYNIETFASARDAWGTISTTIPDAVLTDLIMDGMDGAELCQKIRHNPGTNHIPVIILTSSNDEENIQRTIECGADRYFTKPISIDLLRSVIANTIFNRDTVRNKFANAVDYDYTEIKMGQSAGNLAEKAVEVIKAHIEDPGFGVEDLSREVGMSRVHMNRKLKESINMSPSNLIKSIRLKQAAYLLINDKVNISEVAYRVGFSTHSYFSSSFRDYFGMTPKEFVAKYMNCTDEETLKKIFR